MPSADNKRIAKNAFFLYLRMFLYIVVNLYTVRVIWQVLGIDDYGIYNVVGGIVLMFSFLNGAMVASSQRFISFELGRGSKERLSRVFSLSISIHLILALCIIVLAETVGLWFLNYKLNIPADRMVAANWVYQCSLAAFCVNMISVPYNACMVAHEHMKAFGYFGILEVSLKLVIVFMLLIIPLDKLVTYAVLILTVSVLMRFLYGWYCRSHFEECRYRYVKDHALMRDMFAFAGWSFIGNFGFSVKDQGLNILINMFFNVAVNAAKGIASQVGIVVNGFAQNFQMAINPQITKRYAAGDVDSMMKLVFYGCKYSVFLMLIIVLPLIMASDHILHLWLDDVAEYTTGFLQLTLVVALIDSIVNPITTALQATGKIKRFQIIISIIMISNIPLAWLWLTFDLNPYIVVFVAGITSVVAVATRLMLLHELVPYSYKAYIIQVGLPILITVPIAALISWGIYKVYSPTFLGLLCYGVTSVLTSASVIYLLGLNLTEKKTVNSAIATSVSKIFK